MRKIQIKGESNLQTREQNKVVDENVMLYILSFALRWIMKDYDFADGTALHN